MELWRAGFIRHQEIKKGEQISPFFIKTATSNYFFFAAGFFAAGFFAAGFFAAILITS